MISTVAPLQDRRIVVTGGSRGLGRAMLLALIRAGARTAFVATRESSHLRETLALAAEIEGAQIKSAGSSDGIKNESSYDVPGNYEEQINAKKATRNPIDSKVIEKYR